MKRCSTSLTIREIQIKITVRYQFTSVRMAIMKKTRDNRSVRVEWKDKPYQVFSHLHFVSALDFALLSSLAQFTANQDMRKTETHPEFANLYLSSASLLPDPLMCYSG